MAFTTFILWLHVTAVVFWAGGLAVVTLVVLPVVRNGLESPEEAARVVSASLRRFQRISREIILLILVTGIFNLINAGVARGFDFSRTYLGVLLVKVSLFVVMIVIQAWQTSLIGRTTDAFATAPGPGGRREFDPANHLYRRIMLAGVLDALLAMTVILLGLKLRYH